MTRTRQCLPRSGTGHINLFPPCLNIFGLLLGFLLAGCAVVGPNYVAPDPGVPKGWNTALPNGLTATPPDARTLAGWWSTFKDPELTKLIERAVAGNLDLGLGRARVREARARRGIARADGFPTINVSGAATRVGTSSETDLGTENDLYDAGFDAGWEIDLFGRVRRSVEAAGASLEASQEGLHDVMVSLLAEVALNYVEVRSFQTRLSLAEANQRTQEQTYGMVVTRSQTGLTSNLDLEQARYNLEETRSQIPLLQVGLEQAKNRLAVLVGQNPGSLKDELAERKTIPMPFPKIAVGVPADVLRRRPDIRKAERELAAQTARIGAATALLYPRFTLSGSIGLEALSVAAMLEKESGTFDLGPSFQWNLFDAGRIRQNIEVQNAIQEQALIRYEASVLKALAEVEDTLTGYAEEQVRQRSLKAASGAAQRAVGLAEDQYQSGLTDFQNVLNGQRALLSLQDQLAQSQGAVTSHLISLYKALGGGWTCLGPVAPGKNLPKQ
ncbi:TolC family protein [Desulfobacter hydrogenophilus]|uniref:Efflux transporter outer membrane subunit n=1 Tax=Desulfobacter hydrogenophilus TaxID=2291 RepID=A0A328FFH7_9BACT|nr:efflux transporter outer membrane subunit [Desulfobacter hydrogenophilus]NDY71521.1 efflux transporter outer membrane subunit [Desulfobacter hydrogenophilus]QBH11905.1 efflux transporter outer membrane subunit [Desulfobacter hydrogenophilus]RAM02590.1 TolC family protein [Desulfobacter hydrogenophilus]